MHRFYLFIVFSILSLEVAKAQDTLSLQEAIRMGLENNYSIQIAENNQKISENNYTVGNAGFLPILDAQASQTYDIQDSDQTFANGDRQSRKGAKSNNFNAGAVLEWTVFDGTRMFVAYNRLAAEREVSTVQTEITIENTLAQISGAYYTVMLEQARLNVFQESLELSEERLGIAKAKYEVGKASKLEYLAAQVDFNADKSNLILQKENLYNAKVNLNTLLARPPDVQFAVPVGIDPNLTLDKIALQEMVASSNPDLLLAQRNLNVQYLQMKELKSEILPEISLFTGYNYASSEREVGFTLNQKTDGISYGIRGAINIFDGFNRTREIQNAKILIETTDLQIENLRLELNADLENIYVNYQNSIDLITLERENLSLALENAEITLERYRLGNSNALELREAQRNAVQAQSRLIDAVYTTKIAEIELMRLTGQIVDSAP